MLDTVEASARSLPLPAIRLSQRAVVVFSLPALRGNSLGLCCLPHAKHVEKSSPPDHSSPEEVKGQERFVPQSINASSQKAPRPLARDRAPVIQVVEMAELLQLQTIRMKRYLHTQIFDERGPRLMEVSSATRQSSPLSSELTDQVAGRVGEGRGLPLWPLPSSQRGARTSGCPGAHRDTHFLNQQSR